MTATKTKPEKQAVPPPVGGEALYERPDWLAGPDELSWLAELRERHVESVMEWRAGVAYVVNLAAQFEDAARTWRRSVRDAVASGQEAPQPPGEDHVEAARLQVAREDCVAARDDLGKLVVEALAEVRKPDHR